LIRTFISFLLLTCNCYAVTIDAGTISTTINDEGYVTSLLWPKGPQQIERIYSSRHVLAYGGSTSSHSHPWANGLAQTYSGLFNNTKDATQEARTISEMHTNSNLVSFSDFRIRTSFRSFSESSPRANEIEMVYEFKNQTLNTINDFYYGIDFDLYAPSSSFFGSYNIDAGGNLIYTPPSQNEGAHYIQSKNMFWFGYQESEFYVAVLVMRDSTDVVHTAKLYDYGSAYYNSNYSLISQGGISEAAIDMSTINDPVVFFSLKHDELLPNEKVYMKVVIAFAKTAEELTGRINSILQAVVVPIEPLFSFAPKEGTFEPPAAKSGGGCFIGEDLIKNNFRTKQTETINPAIFNFKLNR
jgi:hypothetical protein